MRPSTLPSSNWVLYWGRPMSSSHPVKKKSEQSFMRQYSTSRSSLFQSQLVQKKEKNQVRFLNQKKLAESTYLSPSWSPAFPYCPPLLSQGPAEPAAASFCAAGVWCPAPKKSTKKQTRLGLRIPGCFTVQFNNKNTFACLPVFLNWLNSSARLTLSRSCWEAWSSVCPEEIQTRAMFT